MTVTYIDGSCQEHHDCTTTVYYLNGEELGRRHIHTWVDVPGLHGRPESLVVIGYIQVGSFLGEDSDPMFDPNMVLFSGSLAPSDVPLGECLNTSYPFADDHRTGKKVPVKTDIRFSRIDRPKKPVGDLTRVVDSFSHDFILEVIQREEQAEKDRYAACLEYIAQRTEEKRLEREMLKAEILAELNGE